MSTTRAGPHPEQAGQHPEQFAQSLEVLNSVVSDHVTRLLDISSGPDGSLQLVTEQLTGGTVSDLIAADRFLSPGEVVTVVSCAARGAAAIQRAGFDLDALDPDRIQLSDQGRPVVSVGPWIARQNAALPRPGLAALVRPLATALLERTTLAPDRIAAFCSAVDALPQSSAELEHLEAVIFALAPAEPVRLMTHMPHAASHVGVDEHQVAHPARSAPSHVSLRHDDRPAQVVVTRARSRPSLDPYRWAVSDALARVRTRLGGRAVSRGVFRLFSGRGRVRRLVTVALTVTAIVGAACILLPASDQASDPTARTSWAATQTPHSGAQPSEEPTAAASESLSGEPTVVALTLLERRAACLRQRSVACLATIVEPGSPQSARDSALLGEFAATDAASSGGSVGASPHATPAEPEATTPARTPVIPPVVAPRVSLIDRTGATALLELTREPGTAWPAELSSDVLVAGAAPVGAGTPDAPSGLPPPSADPFAATEAATQAVSVATSAAAQATGPQTITLLLVHRADSWRLRLITPRW